MKTNKQATIAARLNLDTIKIIGYINMTFINIFFHKLLGDYRTFRVHLSIIIITMNNTIKTISILITITTITILTTITTIITKNYYYYY